MSEPDETPIAAPSANATGHAEGQGRVYQVAHGDQHISYSTHFYGSAEQQASQHPLATEQPPGWEYLLYATVLRQEMDALEGKWLGYRYGHTVRAARYTDDSEALRYFGYVLQESNRIVTSMTGWFSPESQEHAFGRPGEPGRPAVIQHNAKSLCALLGEWLDFALELRSAAIPSRLDRLRELALQLNDDPIRTAHGFIESMISQMEDIPRLLAERVNGQQIRIEMTLTLRITDEALKSYTKEIKRLRRRR
jgi:hypothetical protein